MVGEWVGPWRFNFMGASCSLVGEQKVAQMQAKGLHLARGCQKVVAIKAARRKPGDGQMPAKKVANKWPEGDGQTLARRTRKVNRSRREVARTWPESCRELP